MSINSRTMPDAMRRCLPAEARKELKTPTCAEAQAKLDDRREKELQENIASLLRQRNIWFFRQRMDRRTNGTVGTPDFLFAVNGQAVAFECKLPNGRISTEQSQCIAQMMLPPNGWRTYVIYDEQAAVAILNQLEAYNA